MNKKWRSDIIIVNLFPYIYTYVVDKRKNPNKKRWQESFFSLKRLHNVYYSAHDDDNAYIEKA